MTSRALRLSALLTLVATGGLNGAVCKESPVLTQVATDSSAQRTLFSVSESASLVSGGSAEDSRDWLIVLDARLRQAFLYPDPLASLRTAGSQGPGPFLTASRCGDDCFQPVRWSGNGWQPLGHPIEFDPRSTLHFTYDLGGSPWLVFHQLSGRDGFLEATAYRWDGQTWARRGRLSVQGVGAPGATQDPRRATAILTGTGRFDSESPASYWLPALPALAPAGAGSTDRTDTAGGHVIAMLDAAAVFLTFDGRVTSTDNGESWSLERWTPWPNPLRRSDLWTPGTDYSIDRSAGGEAGTLHLLWYDDRQSASPALHLTRWKPTDGWTLDATVDLTTLPDGASEYVVHSDAGWLLVGGCHETDEGSRLEALIVPAGSTRAEPVQIPLVKGWSD